MVLFHIMIIIQMFLNYLMKLISKNIWKKEGKNEEINQRHKNIASSLQKRTEELIFGIIEKLLIKQAFLIYV